MKLKYLFALLILVLSIAGAQASTFRFEPGDPHYLCRSDIGAIVYDKVDRYQCIRSPDSTSDSLVMFYMHFPEIKNNDVQISFKFSQYHDAYVEVYVSSTAPSYFKPFGSLVYTSWPLGTVSNYIATFSVSKGSGEYVCFAVTLPYYSSNAEFHLYKDGEYIALAPTVTTTAVTPPTTTVPVPSEPSEIAIYFGIAAVAFAGVFGIVYLVLRHVRV